MQTRSKSKQKKQCVICRTDTIMRSGKIHGSIEKSFEKAYCFGKFLNEGHTIKICPKCYFNVYDAVSAKQKHYCDLNSSDLPAFMENVNQNYVSTLQCIDIIRCKVVMEQIYTNSYLDANENCCELDSVPEQFDESIQQDNVERSKTSALLYSSYFGSGTEWDDDDAIDRLMATEIINNNSTLNRDRNGEYPGAVAIHEKSRNSFAANNIANVTNELSRLSVTTLRQNAITTNDSEVVNLVKSESIRQLFEGDGVTDSHSCEMQLGDSLPWDDQHILTNTRRTNTSNSITDHSADRRLTFNSQIDSQCQEPLIRSSTPIPRCDMSQMPLSVAEIAIDDSNKLNIVERPIYWFESICQSVAKLVADSTVYIYGSQLYLNDLPNGDVSSDLNLFIDYEKQYENAVSLTKMKKMKNTLEYSLRNFPSEWTNVDGSCDNRIGLYPVIKAVDARFGINCTFSFANGIFVEANKLLREFISALPMIRDVVNTLKGNNIGTFQFNTYQLTILVLWYFQYRNHLPSVRALQTKITRKNRKLCGDTLINISELPKLIEPMKGSLSYVLMDFFDIFGNEYEPSRDIICPFYGKLFRRNAQDALDADNIELLNLIKNNANVRLWNPPHAFMYATDIFKHSCCPNIMANVSKTAMETFTAQCRKMLNADSISGLQSETSKFFSLN